MTEPLAMYMVEKDGQKIAILNKQYVDDADFTHGEIAMGVMESKMTMKEGDALNEVKAEAVAKKNLRITKKFAQKVDDMITLAKKFEKMSEEYAVMSKLLGRHEKEVQDQLEKYGAQFIRIGAVAIELKKIKGRTTKSYKDISAALEELLPANDEMAKAIDNIEKLNTKVNPDKIKMEYSVEEGKVDEGIKDSVVRFTKALGSWFKELWGKITGHADELETSVDNVAAKLKPLGVKIPTTAEAIKIMKSNGKG